MGIVQSVEHLYVAQYIPCSNRGIHPLKARALAQGTYLKIK